MYDYTLELTERGDTPDPVGAAVGLLAALFPEGQALRVRRLEASATRLAAVGPFEERDASALGWTTAFCAEATLSGRALSALLGRLFDPASLALDLDSDPAPGSLRLTVLAGPWPIAPSLGDLVTSITTADGGPVEWDTPDEPDARVILQHRATLRLHHLDAFSRRERTTDVRPGRVTCAWAFGESGPRESEVAPSAAHLEAWRLLGGATAWSSFA